MWIFTNFGFFSIVQKKGTQDLTVRARVRSDLDGLRSQYLPELSPSQAHAGTDYPWRAKVSHEALAKAMGKIIQDLTYPNFKDEVALKQGKPRAHRYLQVWEALYGMQEDGQPVAKPRGEKRLSPPVGVSLSSGKKLAYGGVVFDARGRVLLREPRNHFDGYVWTFPKGRPEPGETPEAAAIREVLEETGVPVRILASIPGEFMGGTTSNRFFLMEPEGHGKPLAVDDPETSSILWVSPREARKRLALTTNQIGQERDLAVLEAACALVDGFGQEGGRASLPHQMGDDI